MIKTIDKIEEVIDFAWELSKGDEHASYPRRNTKEALMESIDRGINMDEREVIAYYDGDTLCGVCIYFWIEDEKYAQTDLFVIKENFNEIAEKMINYIHGRLKGYEFFIGFPTSNVTANKYLQDNNVECNEASVVVNIHGLKAPKNPSNESVLRITKENFNEYSEFHDKHAIPFGMYWNAENLERDLAKFQVLAYREDGEIHGSIFTIKGKESSDVFGMFMDKEYKDKGIEGILINEMLLQLYEELGQVKQVLYFIDEIDKEELDAAIEAGFTIKERYRGYKYIF